MNVGTVNSLGGGIQLSPADMQPKAAETAGASGSSSQAVERAAQTQFSGDSWNPSGETEFSMSTYTKNGTLVQVVAGNSGFTMGNFQGLGQNANTFQLAGARDDLNMQVLFTTKDGTTKSMNLTESTTFHETEDGQIVEGKGRRNVVKDPNDPETMRDENNIIINLDDDAAVQGGTGDDILLNFGAEARISGDEGDDSIISMGDKVRLDGGAGDDLIKIVEDQIRTPKESTVDLSSVNYNGSSRNLGSNMLRSGQGGLMDLLPEALAGGKDKGTEATIIGGDGNDVIDGREAKLERANVQGNAGNDTMMLDVIVASTVSGGAGDDTIHVKNALMSTIGGGDGNDEITLDKGKNTTILGGKGDDTITTGFTVGGAILGGDGNDSIESFKTVGTLIDGGNGDDKIVVSYMHGGAVTGGNGNDSISIKYAAGGFISGGAGDDSIVVGESYRSIIEGGAGDDKIGVVAARSSLISGGDGKDLILTGSSMGNIIDGGSGEDTILRNVQYDPAMDPDRDSATITDKQVANAMDNLNKLFADGPLGQDYSDEDLETMARQLLQTKEVSLPTDPTKLNPDIVIDDGAIIDGPTDKLEKKLNRRLDALPDAGNLRLSSVQQEGLRTYIDSLRKLVS